MARRALILLWVVGALVALIAWGIIFGQAYMFAITVEDFSDKRSTYPGGTTYEI